MMAREPVSTTTASSESGSLFLGTLVGDPVRLFSQTKTAQPVHRRRGVSWGVGNGMRAFFFAANATMRFIYWAGDGDVSKVGAN
jgi:hypothetical protein